MASRPSLTRRLFGRFLGSAVSNAAGYGMGGAIQPVLEPLTQDIANETWSVHRVKPLGPAAAAEAVVRDLWDEGRAAEEAGFTGIDQDRFDVLHGLAGEPPAPQELLSLWNRGEIGPDEVDRGLRQSRMRPEWYDAFKQLRHVLVPVSDLVRMAVREVFSPSQRRALDLDAEFPEAILGHAADLGLSGQAARDYWAAHWDLPSYTQGTEMLFRGEISDAQFDGLLKALDYAPVWRDKLKNIARRIPPISDMIRFAVREVYSPSVRDALDLDADYPAQFTPEAKLHGMDEERARQYWAAHWRLPSARQGYEMLWRGEITADELKTLLRALDYAPKWRQRLQNIAYHVPGRVDLRRMFAAGVIDRPRVKRGYLDLGYTEADAETLTEFAVRLAVGGSVSAHQTKTEVIDDYLAGFMSEAEFRAALTDLGFKGDALDAEVRHADAGAIKTARGAAVTKVRNAFEKGTIDVAQFGGALAALGMHEAAVQREIQYATIVRDVTG